MITVSDKAIQEIESLAAKRDPKPIALRVGIIGGGCSGFQYLFEWSDKQQDDHDTVIAAGDLQIYIDYKSLIYLDNSILDYKSTLVDRGFYWQNPNQKGSCGCGLSVQF